MSHSLSYVPPNPANAASARFFASIGITAGARVLDVGCGNGDLTRYVARLAGPNGTVTGIDRSEAALAAAREIAAELDAASIGYHAVNLADEMPGLGRFDAIVGRRVLMYLPDAALTLKRLAAFAEPEAILAFQEHARSDLPAGLGHLPLHRRLYDWHWSTVAAEGGDPALALKLPEMMERIGLSIEEVRAEAVLLRPDQPSFLPTLTRGMLSRIVGRGVASVEQIDPDTLDRRIEEEHRASGGTIVWDLAFLVTARAPRGTP